MSTQPTSRQELYERIKETSKQEVIREEMVRLGFWPKDKPIPKDPVDEAKRRAELEKQLKALKTELFRLKNAEAMRKEFRRRRMKESKLKQKETKERRLREKKEKAEAWKIKQQTEITYLGKGVSVGLSHTESDTKKLGENSLPILHSPSQIAEKMGITIKQLRFLSYSREVSTVNHYIRFKIPKKTGGMRTISAPMPNLKNAQYWIFKNILEKIKIDENAHGFVLGRSIMSNAKPHLNSDIVINMDLKDFFPTINYKRVKGLFKSFGYSESVSTVLALICTEPIVEKVEIDGKMVYVAETEKLLPQGAPTSPAITNLICRRMDKRLKNMAIKLNFRYTRYADDTTFSTADKNSNIGRLLRQACYIIESENFFINPNKTRIIRKKGRQEVTGIVVNEKLNIPRKTLKRFRALLFQIEKDGFKGKRWGSSQNIIASIKGFANYVSMVNPKKGNEYKSKISKILMKHK